MLCWFAVGMKKHFKSAPEGNNKFCFPSSPIFACPDFILRKHWEWRKTQHCFPQEQTLSIYYNNKFSNLFFSILFFWPFFHRLVSSLHSCCPPSLLKSHAGAHYWKGKYSWTSVKRSPTGNGGMTA